MVLGLYMNVCGLYCENPWYYRVCEDYNGVVSKVLGDGWLNPRILRSYRAWRLISAGSHISRLALSSSCLDRGCGVRRTEQLSSIKGEVEGHGLSWSGKSRRGSVLDVSSSEFPGHCPGSPHDLSVDIAKFWPLEVGVINIEGVLLSSGVEEEEFPRGSLILVGIDGIGDDDVFGDVGADSNLLGDVPVDEDVGVGFLCRVVV